MHGIPMSKQIMNKPPLALLIVHFYLLINNLIHDTILYDDQTLVSYNDLINFFVRFQKLMRLIDREEEITHD